jgi:hypothetical protein
MFLRCATAVVQAPGTIVDSIVANGKEARSANADESYQFGDFSRGLISSLGYAASGAADVLWGTAEERRNDEEAAARARMRDDMVAHAKKVEEQAAPKRHTGVLRRAQPSGYKKAFPATHSS